MAKIKKQSDGSFLASDEITGEPLAHLQSSGTGSYKTVTAQWHPHILAIHPGAKSMLSKIQQSTTMEGVSGNIDRAFDDLLSGKKHEFDVKKDPETIDHKDPYGGSVKHSVYHFHDKDTGNKILSISSPVNSASSLGTGAKYYDQASLHKQHIGTPENLSVAMKKVGSIGSTPSLKDWASVASNLKKTVSSGGPRFVGTHTQPATSTSRKYKTSIADPLSAITAYAKEAIPNQDKLIHTVATPNMHIFHSPSGNESHIVKFTAGHIHHVTNKLGTSDYEKTPLNHVIEEVIT